MCWCRPEVRTPNCGRPGCSPNAKPVDQEKQDGSPAHVVRPGIDLKFQLGPVAEHGINGCQIEDVIDVLIERLEGFQAGPFHCIENAGAIDYLTNAKTILALRTRRRVSAGVEGTNQAH